MRAKLEIEQDLETDLGLGDPAAAAMADDLPDEVDAVFPELVAGAVFGVETGFGGDAVFEPEVVLRAVDDAVRELVFQNGTHDEKFSTPLLELVEGSVVEVVEPVSLWKAADGLKGGDANHGTGVEGAEGFFDETREGGVDAGVFVVTRGVGGHNAAVHDELGDDDVGAGVGGEGFGEGEELVDVGGGELGVLIEEQEPGGAGARGFREGLVVAAGEAGVLAVVEIRAREGG